MSKNDFKTLIIISPGFPENESDSTCLPAQQIFVKALNKNFPELSVIIIALQYPYHKNWYKWFGNTVIPVNGKKLKLLRPLFWIKTYYLLRRIQQQTKISGILSFWCQDAALIGNLFAKRKNLAHKIWIKGQDARKNNFFVRWINPKKEQLVALSDFLVDEFEKNHGIRPMHVVYNGIDQREFAGLPPQKDIDILGAGSLIPLKQFDTFIDVAKSLRTQHPNLKVVLVGAGTEKNKLMKQIKEAGMEDHVTMPGEISHQKVISLMSRAKILLHPSSYEGYSSVCLEALAAGCHVVSFTAAESKTVPHWHIVKNKEDMTVCCNDLLDGVTNFTPIIAHIMDDSARKILSLFKDVPK